MNETPGLPRVRPVPVAASQRPHLWVVVDTEEEFDWDAPPSRDNTAVSAMRHIGRAQRIFDRFSLRPTYVIDYPVVSQEAGYGPLLELHSSGRCEIGAHLHPWVTPPYAETVSARHMFMMNLPAELQRKKLEVLTAEIATRFGPPRVFKAGRYGLGPAAVPMLERLGYLVDNSVCPRMDFREIGGPSFVDFDSSPFMLTNELMEVPCTVDYVGWLGARGRVLHNVALAPAGRRLKAVGILGRLGAVNRVMLSPEGNTLEEMCQLARTLVRRGCRLLTLSFHSPSLAPGHTPYVRSERDLTGFLDRITRFCEFFMSELAGVPTSPLAFRASGTGIPVGLTR